MDQTIYLLPTNKSGFDKQVIREEGADLRKAEGYYLWTERPTGPEGAVFISHEEWVADYKNKYHSPGFSRIIHPTGNGYLMVFTLGAEYAPDPVTLTSGIHSPTVFYGWHGEDLS